MISFASAGELVNGPPIVTFWEADEPKNQSRLRTPEIDWHRHARGQFFWLDSGQAQLCTSFGSWLLTPRLAGWIPPTVNHSAICSKIARGWGVMLTPTVSNELPDKPCVMNVSELLRVLARRVAGWNGLDALSYEQQRILDVLCDEIRLARRASQHLPLPTDPRLLRFTRHLADHPNDPRSLANLARAAGLSERTARRLFLTETGMSFAQWKQRLRLAISLNRLMQGEPVGDVSHALGYASPSNFIATFRRHFGQSPGSYIRERLHTRPGPLLDTSIKPRADRVRLNGSTKIKNS